MQRKTKARVTKSKITSITINEFKMWLQGVEDMQNPNWTPTPEQWVRIREKINLIEVAPSNNQQPTYTSIGTPEYMPEHPQEPLRRNQSGLAATIPGVQHSIFGAPGDESGGFSSKTPNLEASSVYESSFV